MTAAPIWHSFGALRVAVHPDGSVTLPDPDGEGELRFSAGEFEAFVDGCRKGEFDHLVRETR